MGNGLKLSNTERVLAKWSADGENPIKHSEDSRIVPDKIRYALTCDGDFLYLKKMVGKEKFALGKYLGVMGSTSGLLGALMYYFSLADRAIAGVLGILGGMGEILLAVTIPATYFGRHSYSAFFDGKIGAAFAKVSFSGKKYTAIDSVEVKELETFLSENSSWLRRLEKGSFKDLTEIRSEVTLAIGEWKTEKQKLLAGKNAQKKELPAVRDMAGELIQTPIHRESALAFCGKYNALDGEERGLVDKEIERFIVLGGADEINSVLDHLLSVSSEPESYPLIMKFLNFTSVRDKNKLDENQLCLAALTVSKEDPLSPRFAEFSRVVEKLVENGRVKDAFTLESNLIKNSESNLAAAALLRVIQASPLLSQLEKKRVAGTSNTDNRAINSPKLNTRTG